MSIDSGDLIISFMILVNNNGDREHAYWLLRRRLECDTLSYSTEWEKQFISTLSKPSWLSAGVGGNTSLRIVVAGHGDQTLARHGPSAFKDTNSLIDSEILERIDMAGGPADFDVADRCCSAQPKMDS